MASERQRAALGRYLKTLKHEMWLGFWRIDVIWDGEIDSDALATIKPTFGQKRAALRVCADFFDLEPWEQRRTIVHELIHCYSADVQEYGKTLHTNIGDQTFEAWWPGFQLVVEHMVDGLTTMVASEDSTAYPLPKFPKT